MWFVPSTGESYIWYEDEDSGQWIEERPSIGAVAHKYLEGVNDADAHEASAIALASGKSVQYDSDDRSGFDAALYADAGITPIDVPDTAIASQRLDAMKVVIEKNQGIVRSNVGTIGGYKSLQNPEFNSIAPEADASNVLGGNSGQPNRVGRQVFINKYASAANTTPIPISVGFIVDNLATAGFQTAKVFQLRSDGELLDLVSGTNYTLTGYGTSNLTLTPITTIPVGDSYWVRFIGNTDITGDTPWLTTIAGGYDNINNKLMSYIQGAHCTVMGASDHATIVGGSYVSMEDAGSYCVAGGSSIRIKGSSTGAVAFGKAIDITASTGAVAFGTRLKQVGAYGSVFGFNNQNGRNSFTAGASNLNLTTASFVAGEGNTNTGNQSYVSGYQCINSGMWSHVEGFQCSNTKIGAFVAGYKMVNTGSYSDLVGRENTATHGYASLSGYGAVSRGAGSTRGAGLVGGSQGKLQTTNLILQQLTTDAAEGQLKDANTTTGLKHGQNSAISVKGRCVAYNTNGTEAAVFEIDALARVTTGATVIISGATATLVHSEAGSAGWTLRLQSQTEGLLVRPTGEVGKNIQWVCNLEIVESGF